MIRLAAESGASLATAESCTGGLVAAALTDVPGSSHVFRGSVVAYANETKSAALGVDPSFIEAHGAVSEAVAVAKSAGLPVAYLGDGTNCLFAFDRFPGLLVKNSLTGFRHIQDGASPIAPAKVATGRFEVHSAEKVHPVSLLLATEGFLGAVPWIGLPGSF